MPKLLKSPLFTLGWGSLLPATSVITVSQKYKLWKSRISISVEENVDAETAKLVQNLKDRLKTFDEDLDRVKKAAQKIHKVSFDIRISTFLIPHCSLMNVALLIDLRFESISCCKTISSLKMWQALMIFVIIFGSIISSINFDNFKYLIINLNKKIYKIYIFVENISFEIVIFIWKNCLTFCVSICDAFYLYILNLLNKPHS